MGNSFGQLPLDISGTGPFLGPPELNSEACGSGLGAGAGVGGGLGGEGGCGGGIGVGDEEVGAGVGCPPVVLLVRFTGVRSRGLPGGYL